MVVKKNHTKRQKHLEFCKPKILGESAAKAFFSLQVSKPDKCSDVIFVAIELVCL